MNLLNQFQSEQRMLNELKELFFFVSPAKLRRSIEGVFFEYLLETAEETTSTEKVAHVYYLINFLNEMEEIRTNE